MQPTKPDQAIEYLSSILKGFVKHPETFSIVSATDERGLILNLVPHDKDIALVIGRKGIIAFSLRNLMRLWGMKHSASVKVLINGNGQQHYFKE